MIYLRRKLQICQWKR